MLEVLIPIRNPAEVFERTIDSLLAQTHREFSVLLSDNYSTSGTERITQAATRLAAGGIATRTIRPPWELGRVQHWNWLHHQSAAEWLKPLFVGDWLEPDCLAVCRETMAEDPAALFLFFYFRRHSGTADELCDCAGLQGRLEPARAAELAILDSNFVGGPINVLYRRAAFEAAGGHTTALALLADFDLYARLSFQVPTRAIPRVLGHFLLHEHRFAKRGSGTQRESMNAELLVLTASLRYAATLSSLPIPAGRFARRIARLLWNWLRERAGRRAGQWRRAVLGKGPP